LKSEEDWKAWLKEVSLKCSTIELDNAENINNIGGFGEGGEKTPWDSCLVRPDVIQRILIEMY
jgi:hypothetical protein